MLLGVSAITCQLFKVITLAKCVLTILELNWNQRFRGKKTKLNIYHHTLTSSTQLQNRSFHVVERTRTSAKCPKMKYARAKRAKLLFFIVKYANLWRFCCRRRRGCLSSLLFATVRHYSRYSHYSLFATIRYSLFGFSRHPRQEVDTEAQRGHRPFLFFCFLFFTFQFFSFSFYQFLVFLFFFSIF